MLGATSRIAGGASGDFGGAAGAAGRRRRRDRLALSRRAGARPAIHQAARSAVRLRQAGARALPQDAVRLRPLRFRQELLPRRVGAAADQGEAAGLDHARPVDDASLLRHLDPARHPQGGHGRLPVRRVDLGRRHRRLRDPGLPVRHPAHRAVRRRLVLADLSLARPHLRELGRALPRRQDRRLSLAHRAADHRHGARRLRHLDAARPRTRSSTRSASNTCSPRA